MNLYGFAGGDPVNFSDPFGLCPEGVRAVSARAGEGRQTIIVCEDGTEEVRTGGTPAWRNNNPGNVRGSALAVGNVGGFAVFNTRTEGNEGQWRQLLKDAGRSLTLAQMITKYAPPQENDTQAYIDFVTKRSGISAGTQLSTLTETSLYDIIRAMQAHEGAVAGTVMYRPIPKH